MVGMSIQDWRDAAEIHPSEIRVGDIISTLGPTHLRYTVKMISGPQTSPKQWTSFGSDDAGQQHATTFREEELVRRFARAS
jgi:hypothetical protein